MKYLITGSDGFIGSNLVKDCGKNNDLLLLDIKSGNDITKSLLKYRSFKPKVIFHLAGSTDTRETPDLEMYRNNIVGFLNVLELALKCKSKLIYASTLAICGNNGEPLIPYAYSKQMIEQIAKSFYNRLSIVGLRLANAYGDNEAQKDKMASMVTRWALQIKDKKNPIAFKYEHTHAYRDHVYVKDVVRAFRMAEKKKNGIYDLGSGKAVNFKKILNTVQKVLKSNYTPIFINNPYKKSYQTLTKAKLNWGFKARYSLEQGVKDYLGS